MGLPQISSQLRIHSHHTGSSKSAMKGIFMSQESANATNQGWLVPSELITPGNMAPKITRVELPTHPV